MADNEAYHADATYHSNTQVKTYAASPQDFYLQYIEKVMDRPTVGAAADFGKLVHKYCLELKQPIDELIVEYPRDCYQKCGTKLSPKAASFRENNPGKTCLKADDYLRFLGVTETIEKSWVGQRIEDAQYLETEFYVDAGGVTGCPIPIKCCIDIAQVYDDRIVVTDLKVTDPFQFERSAKNYKYWHQDAHYSRVLYEKHGLPVVFEFAVVEPTAPFRIARRWYGPEERRLAYQAHSRTLELMAESYATNSWEDQLDGEIPLSSWELGIQDDVHLTGATEVNG